MASGDVKLAGVPWPPETAPVQQGGDLAGSLAGTAYGSLIERCLLGDEIAYQGLYDAFAGMLYRLAYGLLRHREDAEEVVQDSFEYAFRRLSRFDPRRSSLKTWLYRITISRCRNKRRRRWLPTFSLQESQAEAIGDRQAPDPGEMAVLSERQQRVWQALGQLSPKLRETALLRYYEGLTYQEIGQVLHIPAKTAESRMRLAHRALRRTLGDDHDG